MLDASYSQNTWHLSSLFVESGEHFLIYEMSFGRNCAWCPLQSSVSEHFRPSHLFLRMLGSHLLKHVELKSCTVRDVCLSLLAVDL